MTRTLDDIIAGLTTYFEEKSRSGEAVNLAEIISIVRPVPSPGAEAGETGPSIENRAVLYFGIGNLLLGAGMDEEGTESPDYFLIYSADEGQEHPIDVPLPWTPNVAIKDWRVKMYFGKLASLNALIHALENFRAIKYPLSRPVTKSSEPGVGEVTDSEIEREAERRLEPGAHEDTRRYRRGFEDGAKWLRSRSGQGGGR